MNETKTREISLIRSRLLATLFSSLLAALVLLPFFTSAKGEKKVKQAGNVYIYPLSKDAHATITLTDFLKGNYNLTIEDASDNIVYYEERVNFLSYFSKIFNLSNLKSGNYKLKVKQGENTKECLFAITDGKIKVNTRKVAEPIFNKYGKKAVFALSNIGDQIFYIKVISPKGDNIYSSKASEKTIKKSFDFSNVASGNYTVLVSSQEDEFAFNFENK